MKTLRFGSFGFTILFIFISCIQKETDKPNDKLNEFSCANKEKYDFWVLVPDGNQKNQIVITESTFQLSLYGIHVPLKDIDQEYLNNLFGNFKKVSDSVKQKSMPAIELVADVKSQYFKKTYKDYIEKNTHGLKFCHNPQGRYLIID